MCDDDKKKTNGNGLRPERPAGTMEALLQEMHHLNVNLRQGVMTVSAHLKRNREFQTAGFDVSIPIRVDPGADDRQIIETLRERGAMAFRECEFMCDQALVENFKDKSIPTYRGQKRKR